MDVEVSDSGLLSLHLISCRGCSCGCSDKFRGAGHRSRKKARERREEEERTVAKEKALLDEVREIVVCRNQCPYRFITLVPILRGLQFR